LAISKERKNEMVDQYIEWVNGSRAMVVTKYIGLNMKDIDELRAKVRESGGEFHIIKNTLGKVAFEQAGVPLPEDFLDGSTAIGFGFEDAPAIAKTISDFARTSDFLTIKGGYLGKRAISADEIKALAELPPLPVMRARLLGTLMAPATRLARTLAEPARQVAAVLKAYADQESGAPETA
jgi:large subunit ribosomal protein L10